MTAPQPFLRAPLLSLTFFTVLALASKTQNKYGNCISKTDATYALPDKSLRAVNPWLNGDTDFKPLVATGCQSNRSPGDICFDKPSIGSGLIQLFPKYFLGLTDRGPTQDCETLYSTNPDKYASAKGKVGTGFIVRRFSPSIAHFSTHPTSRELTTKRFVPLQGKDGLPISGLPNIAADGTPYGKNCKGDPLPLDPSGLDTEDMARIPGTDFVAIVEEYSPSVIVANFKTGQIIARHVPKSLSGPLSHAQYNIVGDIPNVFRHRQRNRGFEAVVVDKKRKYVIAILQSPMIAGDGKATGNNRIIRCAYFRLKVNKAKVPKLSYEKSFIIEASFPSAYWDDDVTAKDLKFSAAQYRSTGKFIIMERAKGQAKLFVVDFLKATNMDKTRFASNLDLEKETNGRYLAKQMGINAAEKTLVWDSKPGVGGSDNYAGSSKIGGIAVDMEDASKLWMIEDNDFGLLNKPNGQLHKLSLGRATAGATVCKIPDHPPMPKISVDPSLSLSLSKPQTYHVSDEPGEGAAKTLDVEEATERTYVVNHQTGAVDLYDVSVKPLTPLGSYIAEEPYSPTSVSVCRHQEWVGVGLQNEDEPNQAGRVDILSKDLKLLRRIKHGACIGVVDVKWSNDCNFILAACKGVGESVPGAIFVIDFGGPKARRFRGAMLADFKEFDMIADEVRANGVRLVESGRPSLDLEPNRIVIDGNHAFVTLQENNAIAVVDVYEAKVTELKPIGYIERSRAGFGIDASDVDRKIQIRNYPFLYGMPQPDQVQKYEGDDGKQYLVFANEGSAKDSSDNGRGADIIDPKKLNRKAVPGLKQSVANKKMLGRLRFSTKMGYNKETNTQEKMFHFGGRSFSIMTLDGTIVFDSGEWFARIQEKHAPKFFNSDAFDTKDLSLSQKDLFDSRSDDMGAEPESVSLMEKNGKIFAFIGLERPSIVLVFDISNAKSPIFADAVHNHPLQKPAETIFEEGKQGYIDPQGLFASSKLNRLFVAGSASSTITSYDIETY